MNGLDIQKINAMAPYLVSFHETDESYIFVTDSN